MRILDAVWIGGRILIAVALLGFAGFMALLALLLALRQQFAPALGCGVLATVPLGPGVVMMGEAIQSCREARDPLASLTSMGARRPRLSSALGRCWSVFSRLCAALLFLSLGLAMTLPAVDGLITHPSVVQVLFALALALLGVTGLGIGLSLLVNRGYWLWDQGSPRGGPPLSQWRGGKRRW